MPCDEACSKMGPWSTQKFVCVGHNAVSRTNNWPICVDISSGAVIIFANFCCNISGIFKDFFLRYFGQSCCYMQQSSAVISYSYSYEKSVVYKLAHFYGQQVS